MSFQSELDKIIDIEQLPTITEEEANECWRIIPIETPAGRLKFKPQSGREKRRPKILDKFKEAHEQSVLQALRAMEKDPQLKIEMPALRGLLPPREIRLKKQSGVVDANLMTSSLDMKSENVAFADFKSSTMYAVDSEMDPTRMLQDTNDATLDNFFKRPIKIREFEWGTNTTLAQDFNPWEDYFENPRVINRLTNYNLLRAKLHVKIIVNGNGFQYGRALMAYNPLDDFDELSTHSALVRADLVQTSQLPHVYLDPTTSQGGDLLLPFFYYKNYLNIAEADWREMGRMYLRSLNSLKHANGATDLVTISVFAWAEDVSMSVLTNVDSVALQSQSGKEIDEANTKGMVSGPASVVAKAARAASGIGVIAPYAMATAKVADMVGGVAKLFGYCAPPITKAPEPYRPSPTGSLAVTTVPQNVNKLTVDDKQELSIDPRIAGLGSDDPMMIKNIAMRESYLTTFDWTVGSSPETLLWNSRVCPVTWAETGLSPNSYMLPACAMAALPFKYWTGTMKYRFQIVASNFHKGRLKIVYDPNHIDNTEYNTNYMRVIDMSQEQDFTIEVGVGQERTLLENPRLALDAESEVYSTAQYTGNAIFGNGTLSVYIVNELTVPNSTINNDIQVNVFVSAGQDFEVFVPDSSALTSTTFFSQSGEEIGELVPDAQRTTEPSAPLQETSDTVGPGEQDLSNINKVFTGEAIHSFRPLLKRSVLHESLDISGQNISQTGTRCFFPGYRGAAPDAVHSTLSGDPYNYFNTTLLHWISTAHQGRRGSLRWKLIPRNHGNTNQFQLYAGRNRIGIGSEYQNAQTTYLATSNSQVASQSIDSFFAVTGAVYPGETYNGQMYTHGAVNPVAEIECPYYSPFRYVPGKEASYTGIETFDATYRFSLTANNDAEATSIMDFWVSTGEDFQVYFWTGLPRIYYESFAPIPSAS